MDVSFSITTLYNYAAAKIGAKSFNIGDGSNSDKVFAIVGNTCIQFCLEECPWTFATKSVGLTQVSLPTTTPAFQFADGIQYGYSFPTDYLKAIYFNPPQAYILQENIPGTGTVILANVSSLFMKYVFNNQDPTSWSLKFYEAVACKLAEQACFKLSEAAQYQAKMTADYERAFLSAAASDGQTTSPEVVNQGFWEWARLSGSNAVVGDPPNSLNVGWWPGGGGWA